MVVSLLPTVALAVKADMTISYTGSNIYERLDLAVGERKTIDIENISNGQKKLKVVLANNDGTASLDGTVSVTLGKGETTTFSVTGLKSGEEKILIQENVFSSMYDDMVEITLTVAEPHTHDGITFQPWDKTNSLPTAAGSYYLIKDVTISEGWEPPRGETDLCLNGHEIRANECGVIVVWNRETLNIYDCKNSGVITGGKTTSGSGGVSVEGGSVTMNGGTITGNESYNGGGVLVDSGSFAMNGGIISNNTSTIGIGGGVAVYGGSVIVGGTANITGNTKGTVGSETANNLFFEYGKTITLGTKTQADNGNGVPVPAAGMSIGVTSGIGAPAVITANGTEADMQYFFADAADQYVSYNNSGYLELCVVPDGEHKVNIGSMENGTVYAVPQAAAENADVKITVAPNEGYKLTADTLVVTYNIDKDCEVIAGGSANEYTFKMPAYDVTVSAEFEKIYHYIDENGQQQTVPAGFTKIDDSFSTLQWPAGWYVVTGKDVKLDNTVTLLGDVHLVLCDGAKLTVKGTPQPEIDTHGEAAISGTGKAFTVYAETEEGTGVLDLIGGEGREGMNVETFTLNGGNVSAVGGPTFPGGGPGDGIFSTNLTVNNGSLTAEGFFGIDGTNFTQNGGEVTAKSLADINHEPFCIFTNFVINQGKLTAVSQNEAKAVSKAPTINGFVKTCKVGAAAPGSDWDRKTALNTYKYVDMLVVPPHVHDFVYSVSGDTVTALCGNGDGNCLLDNYKVTLTLIADDAVYTGSAYKGAYTNDADTGFTRITPASVGNIAYYLADDVTPTSPANSGAAADGKAPKNAGSYVAKVTVTYGAGQTLTAKAPFTIYKATQPDVTVTMADYTYAGSVPTPGYTGSPKESPTVKYYYNQSGLNTSGTEWTGISGTSLNIGNYYIYAVLADTTNYKAKTTAATPFTVYKASQTDVSVIMADYTYGDTPTEPDHTYTLREDAEITYYYSTSNSNASGTEWTGMTGTSLNAGNYYVCAVIADTANYKAKTTAPVPFTVAKRPATVTALDKSATVGEKLPALNGDEYTVTGAASGETLTGITVAYDDTPDMNKVGEYVIKVSDAGLNGNYDLTLVDGKLTVEPSPVEFGPAYGIETDGSVKLNRDTAYKGNTAIITPEGKPESARVIGEDGSEIPVGETGDGRYYFTMPDMKVRIEVSYDEKTPFVDVKPTDYFFDAV